MQQLRLVQLQEIFQCPRYLILVGDFVSANYGRAQTFQSDVIYDVYFRGRMPGDVEYGVTGGLTRGVRLVDVCAISQKKFYQLGNEWF